MHRPLAEAPAAGERAGKPAGWGTLDLAPIGNCSVASLVDRQGTHVWACLPRFDGDPFFSALLNGVDPATEPATGLWAIDVEGATSHEQNYLRNTAVLRTLVTDRRGGRLEILDFAPRHRRHGRTYRPTAFARVVRPLAGHPRIRMRLRPTVGWSTRPPGMTSGSNHVRYLTDALPLRLTTDAPIGHVLDERWFRLEHDLHFFLGPDEPFMGELASGVRQMLDATALEWQLWVRGLALPVDWQEEVIRAAIALRLCMYEETGAIVAALTTSIPEAPFTIRNWDYRYCWIRDAYYTVEALNRLGALDVLENYLGFLRNIVDMTDGGHIQPLYGIGLETQLTERIEPGLAGYRGMGPVRVGNQAAEHVQNDVYGQIVLSNVQGFFDQRLLRPADLADFEALERVGERAFRLHDQPDAGLWELRTRARVHTYSSLMCWAACDRLARAADAVGRAGRAGYWQEKARLIRLAIEERAWNPARGHFAASFGGAELDASLLQLAELRFLAPEDPRFLATLEAIERDLVRADHMLRYSEADDFGEPETAFNFCTFWLIDSLKGVARVDEARRLYDRMLGHLTHSGLLSEDTDYRTGEAWGNFPQTYSLSGVVNGAVRLSRPWSAVR